jgi:hypothetical protein
VIYFVELKQRLNEIQSIWHRHRQGKGAVNDNNDHWGFAFEEELAPSKGFRITSSWAPDLFANPIGPVPSIPALPLWTHAPRMRSRPLSASVLSRSQEPRVPSGLGPAPSVLLRLPQIDPASRSSSGLAGSSRRRGADRARAMPARSRPRPRPLSGSPPRAPPPPLLPLQPLHSAKTPRVLDSDGASDADADADVGSRSPTPAAEVSGR